MPAIRRGFTLIELIVVLLILAGLAEIAASLKEQAYVATLKSDLANLASAQDAYFAEHHSYTTALTVDQYNTSVGVSVSVAGADAAHWTAIATHTGTKKSCMITFGGGATTDGMPVCS